MTRHFCTYFDRNYLARGLALYRSLHRTCPSVELWVLCLDMECYQVLLALRLPDMHLISLAELERHDSQLRAVKGTRSLLEYYFTCSPCLPSFVLSRHAQVNQITYLDADLYFFRDPSGVFDEIGDASIAIIPHRFHPAFVDREQFGIFNVGWVSFRRDETGLACLARWREQCVDWCYARCEADRFGDQKYLDQWPTAYSNVAVVQHKGANLAPWNVLNYRLYHNGSDVCVESEPLIFFHFHYLKQVNAWVYNPGLAEYKTPLSRILRSHVYAPYIRALQSAEVEIRRVRPSSSESGRLHQSEEDEILDMWRRWTVCGVLQSVSDVARLWYRIVAGDYLVVRPE